MLMKRLLCTVLAVLMAASLFAGETEVLGEADTLWSAGYFRESLDVVDKALPGTDGFHRAELLWRRARAIHDLTGSTKSSMTKDEILESYLDGRRTASEALELNPDSAWAYYWRSANVGSWGDTKGVLNSLDKLPDMEADLAAALSIDPDHGDSWSVLAIIDASVPGVLGGSMDDAVSLDRKAVSCWDGTGEIPLEWFGELANHLHWRGFDAEKRNKKHGRKKKAYGREDEQVLKNKSYEGMVDFDSPAVYTDRPLAELSDKQESRQLLEWLVENLESEGELTPYQEGKLNGYRSALEDRDYSEE